MNPDFENCLKKNKIRKFSPGKSLTGKEIATAESDIKEAKEGLQRGKNLREDADYYNEWSKAGSEEMIKIAYEFLEVASSIDKQQK